MDLYTTKTVSPQGQINKKDLQTWLRNGLIFAGPALIVLLASATSIVPVNWRYGAIALYAINFATDLIRKFLDGNK